MERKPLSQIVNELEILKSGRGILENKSEWVSVKDRLPEDKMQPVIIAKFNGLVCEMMYQDGKFEYWQGRGQWLDQTSQITHWMPLPKPPTQK